MIGRTASVCGITTRTFLLTISIVIGLTGSALAEQPQTLKVGTAVAFRGEKATGFIEVPPGVDPGTNIPLVVINGSKPGPVLALVSGLHGTEYVSIIALEKLIGALRPEEIRGAVIIVPLVNLPSFEQKVPHVNPVDRKSMNRFYPGKADGTQTDRASYLITKQVVDQCDYLIDLHGGDLDESLHPYCYWTVTGNAKQDEISREMVLAFGIDHIIITDERPKEASSSRYLDNTASTRGKPAFVAEAGYSGTVETDDVALLVNGCLGVMRYLKMLQGEVTRVEHPVWLSKVVEVTSEQTGIFYPLVKRGTYVAKGMKLGYVTDFLGKTISEPVASDAGVILHICSLPSMNKGDGVADIGVPSQTEGSQR
jgi:predicted deacylase